MPRIVLNEARTRTQVPLALITVQGFPAAGGAPLRLAAARGGVPLPPPPVPPPPGVLLVPADGLEDVTVSVAPRGGGVFPPGTRVTVVLEAGSYTVEVAAIDVAGLVDRDVLRLRGDGDRLDVQALLDAGGPGAPLTPLGEAVRVAAIDVVGGQRVADDAAFPAGIVIDGSASFRRLVANGALERTLEVISGVLSVTSAGFSTRVSVSGAPARSEVVDAPGDAVARAERLVAAAPLVAGARLDDPALYAGAGVSYVITDAEPAELPAAAGVHVVIVGDPSLAVGEVGGVPATVIDERVLAGDSAGVASALPAKDVVRSLLRGAFAPHTAIYERVTR